MSPVLRASVAIAAGWLAQTRIMGPSSTNATRWTAAIVVAAAAWVALPVLVGSKASISKLGARKLEYIDETSDCGCDG